MEYRGLDNKTVLNKTRLLALINMLLPTIVMLIGFNLLFGTKYMYICLVFVFPVIVFIQALYTSIIKQSIVINCSINTLTLVLLINNYMNVIANVYIIYYLTLSLIVYFYSKSIIKIHSIDKKSEEN
ncbi:MAG: hypothetical protein RSD85_02740 [Erysipelotrichaceae bacterium]